jgi:hypothetical protein
MAEPVEHIEYRSLTGPKWGHVRLYLDDVDHTMFRDMPAQIGELQYEAPYMWGPANFRLPQVEQWEVWGEGDLVHIFPGAHVRAIRVDEDGVPRELMWKGFLANPQSTRDGLELACAGWISGQLINYWWPGPTNEKRKDVGLHIFQQLRAAGIPNTPIRGVVTGLEIRNNFAPSTGLELMDNLLGLGMRFNGQQLSVWVDPDDIRGRARVRWRESEVAAKVFLGPGASISAGRELTDEPTSIFGSTQRKNGELQRNIKRPFQMNGDPEPPPTSVLPLQEGDEGPYVALLKTRLVGLGHLDPDDLYRERNGVFVPGTYNEFNAPVTRAVREFQDRGGLAKTGVVNAATWNKMYDLKRKGKRRTQAYVAPLVELPETRKWDHTATGVAEGPNALYDPDRIEIHRHVEAPVNKDRLTRWARNYMNRVHDNPPHVGEATIELDLFPPGFVHGAPLDDDDRISLMDIRRVIDQKVTFAGYQGDMDFHVAGASLDCTNLTARLNVDTASRDLQEVIDIAKRRHETRQSHSRQHVKRGRGIGNAHRKQADERAGWLDDPMKVGGDRWSVFEIDWAHAAFARKIRVEVDHKCEFVFALFGQKVTRAKLNNWFGNPWASGKWETATARRLADEDDILLFAAGDEDQPCGYSPRRKTGANNQPTGAPLTGLLLYSNPVSLITHGPGEKNLRPGSLYGAIYPRRNTRLPMQRIATPMGNDND